MGLKTEPWALQYLVIRKRWSSQQKRQGSVIVIVLQHHLGQPGQWLACFVPGYKAASGSSCSQFQVPSTPFKISTAPGNSQKQLFFFLIDYFLEEL